MHQPGAARVFVRWLARSPSLPACMSPCMCHLDPISYRVAEARSASCSTAAARQFGKSGALWGGRRGVQSGRCGTGSRARAPGRMGPPLGARAAFSSRRRSWLQKGGGREEQAAVVAAVRRDSRERAHERGARGGGSGELSLNTLFSTCMCSLYCQTVDCSKDRFLCLDHYMTLHILVQHKSHRVHYE